LQNAPEIRDVRHGKFDPWKPEQTVFKATYVLEAINNERRLEELLIYTAVLNSLK